METIDGLLAALSYPQRKLKEAVSGDELEWFSPDGMNPHLYAATNTALDLVADPLNLVPAGLFAKAGKAASDMKGAVTGAFPNYIKNFYGLTDGSRTSITPLEKMGVQAVQKATGLPYDEALGAVRKATGFAGTAAAGASEGVKNLVSPTRRAAVREGMNPGTQRWVQQYLDEIQARGGKAPREQEKATANVNYMNHIRAQSGSNQPITPAVAEIANRSNLETYTPNKPGQLTEWMQKNGGTNPVTNKPNVMPEADAKTIEDHVLSAWKGADTLVMKRARSGTGGNHFTDMYAGRSPMARPVAGEVVSLMQKHGDDWAKHMPEAGKNWRLKKVNDDGSVWVTSRGRNVGTAITEGGVNWLAKIEKDGTIMSVISDKHDFLEKVPGMGKEIARALPNELIAVTPPMYTNVKSMMRKQAKGLPEAGPPMQGVQRKKASKEANTLTLLEEFVSAKPSEQAVKREQLVQSGMLTSAIAAGVTPQDE